AQQVLEKKLWALMLIPLHGDPVYLSSWILRESCERERTAFVRVALDKTAPLLGTRCIYRRERSWATSLSDWAASWFKPGKDSVWTPSKQCPLGRNYLDAYLEDAVASGRVTQEDLAQTFPSCPHLTSTSWPDGKVV